MKRFAICLLSALALSACGSDGDRPSTGPTFPAIDVDCRKNLPQTIASPTVNNVNIRCGDDVAVVPPVVVTPE